VGEANAALRFGDDDTALAFELMVKPNHGGYIVGAGDYQLDVVVAAENAPLLQKTVEIMLGGRWYEDETRMLRDGVRVRILN